MATNIGRVGIVMKGDYNSASTYETLDAVSYQNGLYIAKQNVPAGTVPTNTTYWQMAVGDIKCAVMTYPIALEKSVGESTWLNINIKVNAGDNVEWTGQSSSNSGRFSTEVTGSDGHIYTNGDAAHSDFNTPGVIYSLRAISTGTINFKSYTNTATTFSNMAITVSRIF